MKENMTPNLSRLRRIIAQKFPPEQFVLARWNKTIETMGQVPASQTTFDLKIVLFLIDKAERLIMDEYNFRSQESTLRALDKIETVKKEAKEILLAVQAVNGS